MAGALDGLGAQGPADRRRVASERTCMVSTIITSQPDRTTTITIDDEGLLEKLVELVPLENLARDGELEEVR